jgi:hypothetical protein
MRLPMTIALSVLTALGVLGFDSACTPGTTVVLITDCGNAPVEAAHIDIKVCCSAPQQQFSAVTAKNGEATFSLNAREICDGKVSFPGFSATVFGTGSCTAPDANGNSKCTVQVCKH